MRMLAACRSELVKDLRDVGVEALASENRGISAKTSIPECLSDRLLEKRIAFIVAREQ